MKKLVLIVVGAVLFAACGSDNSGGGSPGDKPKLSCAGGYTGYQVEETPIQFCYDPAWGQPTKAQEGAKIGSAYMITFPDAVEGPKIWLGTEDYQAPGGEPTVAYDKFNLYGNEELVADSVVEAVGLKKGDFVVRKNDVGGRRGIRVDAENTLTIYVPDAFEGYNLAIIGDDEVAEEVDDMAFDMKF